MKTMDPRQAEQKRKVILTRIHRIVDAYRQGKTAGSCMHDIEGILGRKADAKEQA